jgi:hypothetical protein
MKKCLSVLTLVAVFFTSQAQEGGGGPKNAIKLNPLSLVFATGNIAYERAIGERTSIQLGGYYGSFGLSDIKYTGFGITPEMRFYFAGAKQALNGVYVGPFARYQSFSLKDKTTDDKASFTSIGGGAIIGWQKAWSSGFVLDLFAGPSFNSGKFKDNVDEEEWSISGGIDGFGIRTGISLGFSF